MRPGGSAHDFDVAATPAADSEWELSETDLERTIEIAHESGSNLVVVDHYGADAAYFEAIRAAGLTLAVIDDRADRDLRAASVIVNQSIAAPTLDIQASTEATLLLGPRYALLRPEFAATRATLERRFTAGDKRVLVTLGGGDTADLCIAVIEAVQDVDSRLEIRCIATDASEALERAAGNSPHSVTVLPGVDTPAEHMAWCDVSVNAGGSTCWELLCLGVPMIVLALSSDQRRNPPALQSAGVALAVDSPAAAARAVPTLLADPGRRSGMSAAGMELVDGAGAARVTASFEEAEKLQHADR
jgi:UDP-2,4-diacetamido-2,4,6-trideoxy-beta-L-altropyranose hydrolase